MVKKILVIMLVLGLVSGLIAGYILAPKGDTAVLEERITELEGVISELQIKLSENDAQVADLEEQITEKDTAISKLQTNLSEKDDQITDLEAQVKEKDAMISTLQEEVNELKKLVPPYRKEIEPANFVDRVDNRYFPLTPGTTFVYEGKTEDATVRVEDYVTHETKQVLGVTCVVVRNRVIENGDLVEETFDWYAQDKDGNVWYFGEDAKEYEAGVVVSTKGSWEAGVDGAMPGIIMEANPQVGDFYRQEYYKGEAEDMAEVLSLTESASVIYGSFDNLLMTREWTLLEPGIVEHKYYAPGVGLILEVMVEGGSERVELVEITTEQV